MIGPLIGAAASNLVSRSVREASEAARNTVLSLVVFAIAGSFGMVCVTAAAFVALRDRIGSAEALGLLGAFYLAVAGIFFLARRRSS